MSQPSEANAFAQALRQRAEAKLRHQPPETVNTSEADQQRLVHELRVHQIELELQNAALRRSQAELQNARDQYAMLYDFAPVGYLTLDAQGTILEANLTAATMLGVTRHTLPGTPLSHFVDRDDQDRLYLHRRQVFEVDTLETCDLHLQRSDGTLLVVALESRRVRARSGQEYQCLTTLSDISERQRVAVELQRAERLALVGQLASGLAHEMGTSLNIISGSSELLCMDLQAQHLPTETVEVIIRQTDRLTGLVQQLLTSSHPEQQVMRPLPLRRPLEEALRLLETPFQHDAIAVTLDIPDDVPVVWGSAEQIEQVFLNILVNAWHAMPTGGSLTIRARETADKRIRMTFRDTGVGMERAAVERVFEPFYTTKGHLGTGLGLTICKQMIEAHQGHITLKSTPGAGTTVCLDLLCAPVRRSP